MCPLQLINVLGGAYVTVGRKRDPAPLYRGEVGGGDDDSVGDEDEAEGGRVSCTKQDQRSSPPCHRSLSGRSLSQNFLPRSLPANPCLHTVGKLPKNIFKTIWCGVPASTYKSTSVPQNSILAMYAETFFESLKLFFHQRVALIETILRAEILHT